MPTLVRESASRFLIAKGVHLYLSNECSETPNKKAVNPPHLSDAYLVFGNMKHLYFTESELVGSNNIFALFRLNKEDWSVARYIVVDVIDVYIIQDATATMDYQIGVREFYDDSLPF